MQEKYDINTIKKYYEENKYARNKDLREIEKIVYTYQGIRLGINGGWGSGKTVLAKKIYFIQNDEYLKEINKEIIFPFFSTCKIIYFDASKEDIFKNPLLSIAKVVSKELNKENKFQTNEIFEGLVEMFSVFDVTGKVGTTLRGARKALKKKYVYSDLYDTDKIIEKIINLFEENHKYLLIIDELDRCDPKYALELLTTVKHFFNISNLSIIYFYNYNELWKLIKNEYGYENEQYLQKFIDYEYKLNDIEYPYVSSDNLLEYYISICAVTYKLNPREIKNLRFIASKEIVNVQARHLYELMYLAFIVIKKEKEINFTSEVIEERRKELEQNIINLSVDNFKNEFFTFTLNLTKVKEKYKNII